MRPHLRSLAGTRCPAPNPGGRAGGACVLGISRDSLPPRSAATTLPGLGRGSGYLPSARAAAGVPRSRAARSRTILLGPAACGRATGIVAAEPGSVWRSPGRRIRAAGFRQKYPGSGIQAEGSGQKDPGSRILTTRSKQRDPSRRLQAAGFRSEVQAEGSVQWGPSRGTRVERSGH
ncbi:hypothetical protein NN561_012868 [Cricetulus griseus]